MYHTSMLESLSVAVLAERMPDRSFALNGGLQLRSCIPVGSMGTDPPLTQSRDHQRMSSLGLLSTSAWHRKHEPQLRRSPDVDRPCAMALVQEQGLFALIMCGRWMRPKSTSKRSWF